MKYHLIGFFLLTVIKVFGQTRYDLSKALDEATRNYPFLKAKLAEKNIQENYFQAAKTDYLPDLAFQQQFNFGTDNSVNGAASPIEGSLPSVSGGIRKENIYQPIWGNFTTVQVNWRLFTFGKIKSNLAVFQKSIQKSQMDYENEVFQHQIRVTDAYLSLLIAEKLLKIQLVNLNRAETFRGITVANVKSGLKAGVDSSVANAEVSKAKILLFQTQENEQRQRIRLSELMGISSTKIDVDSMQFYQKIPQTLENTLDIRQNPLLNLYQSQIDLINSRVIAINKSFLPTVNLNLAFWGRGSGINNQTAEYSSNFLDGASYQVGNYLLGVGLRWNFTSYYRINFETKAEIARSEQYQELYNEQALHLQKQLEQANSQLELTLKQAFEAPIQIDAARQAYEQSLARYRTGLTTLLEVAQSLNILNRAEIDSTIAVNNVWRALLIKSATVGDFSLFLNQIR